MWEAEKRRKQGGETIETYGDRSAAGLYTQSPRIHFLWDYMETLRFPLEFEYIPVAAFELILAVQSWHL